MPSGDCGSKTVVLTGDLDIYGVPAIREALDALNGPGTVDMRKVRYLDSSALSELVRLAKRVSPGRVTLLVMSASVRRVLEIVEFKRLFEIVEHDVRNEATA